MKKRKRYGSAAKLAQRQRRALERQRLTLNLDKEKGKVVTVVDVSMHALDGHPPCRGRGILPGSTTACKCALKRFFTRHPEVILDETGAAFWPVKKEKTDADQRGAGEDRARTDEPGAGEGGG